MKVKLRFIPLPSNLAVIPESAALLCIDADDGYFIGHRIGDEIEVVTPEDAPDEIEIAFVAVLPDPVEVAEAALD
jgi:hypothetical protein